jgi:hypothetical protein
MCFPDGMPYQVYRRTSASWPNARPELVRLISFVLLSLTIVCSLGLSILLTWSALALLLSPRNGAAQRTRSSIAPRNGTVTGFAAGGSIPNGCPDLLQRAWQFIDPEFGTG